MPARNLKAELEDFGLTVEDVGVMQKQMDKNTDFFDAAGNLLSLAIYGHEIESLQRHYDPPISRVKALNILIRRAP